MRYASYGLGGMECNSSRIRSESDFALDLATVRLTAPSRGPVVQRRQLGCPRLAVATPSAGTRWAPEPGRSCVPSVPNSKSRGHGKHGWRGAWWATASRAATGHLLHRRRTPRQTRVPQTQPSSRARWGTARGKAFVSAGAWSSEAFEATGHSVPDFSVRRDKLALTWAYR